MDLGQVGGASGASALPAHQLGPDHPGQLDTPGFSIPRSGEVVEEADEVRDLVVRQDHSTPVHDLRTGHDRPFNRDDTGTYRIELPAGVYIIGFTLLGIEMAEGIPAQVSINPGETLTLDISVDTGIR